MKRSKNLILEFTEFNAMRMGHDAAATAPHVDNPGLSINAFDKHQDRIRGALSQLGTLHKALSGTNGYKNLRAQLGLEEQDLQGLKIIRVVKSNMLQYDVYVLFLIREKEYWGVVKDIFGNTTFKSEVFNDNSLLQTITWTKRITGLLIKTIKKWFKPQFGSYKLLSDEINCYSSINGKLMILPQDSQIEVLKSYNDRIIFEYENDQYTLTGDNFIYFNWWFEPIKED